MTLPPLALPSDVAPMLGRDLTAAELGYATSLIAMGTALVRSYTRQQISAVAGDVITLAGNWGQSIVLPQRPVTAITSITVNGSTLNPASYKWDRHGNVYQLTGSALPDSSGTLTGAVSQLWGPAGSSFTSYAGGPSWSGPMATIVVTYDHGYAVTPLEVTNEIVGMVALRMATGVGVDKETIGTYSVSYVRTATGGLSLSDASKKVLDQFRKRAATVSIATRR